MSDYKFEDTVAHLTLDSGKVNALGSASLEFLQSGLDTALEDEATAVILSGKSGVFSAGLDLEELRSGPEAEVSLRCQVVDVVLRLFTFERPVIVACAGHALGAGAAILLGGDRRIGADGRFKIGFNEARLGFPISGATVELARYRMPMPWFESLISGDVFAPNVALSAGLLDAVVEDDVQLADAARTAAETLGSIPHAVFAQMRNSTRGVTADAVRLERSKLSAT